MTLSQYLYTMTTKLLKRFSKTLKQGEMMSYTIKDIAKEAGVSITTVSKVLNGNDFDISKQTKERVLKIISDRHYIPSSSARSLVTKRTNTIGLVIPDITNSYFAEIAMGIEDSARRLGYFVIFCNTSDNPELELNYLRLLLEQSVDGFIIVPTTDSKYADFDMILRSKKPAVFLDRVFDELDKILETTTSQRQGIVVLDNVHGGYIATRHLIENDHRRIGCITGPLKNKSAQERLAGYCKALKEADIPFEQDLVVEGNYRHNSGEQAALQLLKKEVTAIFIQNDLMAVSAYTAIEQCGYKVGTDISIVGYDDTEYCNWVTPKLSSVEQPSIQMGIQATKMLVSLIKGDYNNLKQEFIPQLHPRHSVGLR